MKQNVASDFDEKTSSQHKTATNHWFYVWKKQGLSNLKTKYSKLTNQRLLQPLQRLGDHQGPEKHHVSEKGLCSKIIRARPTASVAQ